MVRFFHRGNDALVEINKCGFVVGTVFDVGGHRGESIEWFAKHFKPVRVHSFEPITEHLEDLLIKVDALDQAGTIAKSDVIVNDYALGRAAGSQQIIVQGPGTHLRKPNEAAPADRTREIVVETLDRYVERGGVDHIDLLKIDVEGLELDVLAGGEAVFASEKVSFIYLEVGMNRGNTHHTYFLDILNFLQPRGFEIFGVYEQINEFLTDRPHVRRANFCFIHRRLCASIPLPR